MTKRGDLFINLNWGHFSIIRSVPLRGLMTLPLQEAGKPPDIQGRNITHKDLGDLKVHTQSLVHECRVLNRYKGNEMRRLLVQEMEEEC